MLLKKISYVLCPFSTTPIWIMKCRHCPLYRDEDLYMVTCWKGKFKKIAEVLCHKRGKQWVFIHEYCDKCKYKKKEYLFDLQCSFDEYES